MLYGQLLALALVTGVAVVAKEPATVVDDGYLAKITCKNAPYVEFDSLTHRIKHSDYDVHLRVTLGHDNRSVLLNGVSVFPELGHLPQPPRIRANLLQPTFDESDESIARSCLTPFCSLEARTIAKKEKCYDWCHETSLGAVQLDYEYKAQRMNDESEEEDADEVLSEIIFDVFGGQEVFATDAQFDYREVARPVVRVVVVGTEIKGNRRSSSGKSQQAGSDLFSRLSEPDKLYAYRIVSVELTAREHNPLSPTSLSIWGRVRRFFGADVWSSPNHLVFYSQEWGLYGKLDSLRNISGNLIHWSGWPLFWMILTSILLSIGSLFAAYNLFFWVRRQRHLAKWDGMDNVWDTLRIEASRQEQDALLQSGGYRDDPGEGGSSQPPPYSDELDVMKPLPDRPLPEKPLPSVPLIDA